MSFMSVWIEQIESVGGVWTCERVKDHVLVEITLPNIEMHICITTPEESEIGSAFLAEHERREAVSEEAASERELAMFMKCGRMVS